MTINTPNLNIPKLTDSDNFNTTTFGNIVDAIDQNAAKAQTLTEHTSDNLSHVPYATATGTANTYAITLNAAPDSYIEGMAVAVKINLQNTGVSTINVNGLGAKTIKKANGNDVSSGNLKANSVYTLRYNGTNFILQGEGASGNATASDLLSGKTASTDAGDIVGTMTNNGAVTITPGAVSKSIPAGYHNGSGVVTGDVDLIPANILSGKNIFGVNGSLVPGKKFASGTVAASQNTTFQEVIGVDSTTSFIPPANAVVTGLSFTPSYIMLWWSNAYLLEQTTYISSMNGFGNAGGDILMTTKNYGQGNAYSYLLSSTLGAASITSNGFTLPVGESGVTFNWIAFE